LPAPHRRGPPSRPPHASKLLALVEDDAAYAEYLTQYLVQQGIFVRRYADSNDLLADRAPYDYGFYLLDLSLPGVDGVELIRILRKRSAVGIVVVSGRRDTDVFERVMEAGADMYLAKPIRFEQVMLAIQAVQRRVSPAQSQGLAPCWSSTASTPSCWPPMGCASA
jgi:DNA-binding response OmpR family regulator